MILYYAVTTFQLFNIIFYRCNAHKDRPGVLIISTWLCNKFPHYKELYRFFDEVLVDEMVSSFTSEAEIIAYYQDYLKKHGYSLEKFSDFYITPPQYFFGVFLVLMKKQFSVFEEGAGAFSNPGRLIPIDERVCPFRSELAKQYDLYEGRNEYVKKRIGSAIAQASWYQDDAFEDLDIIKNFYELDEDDQQAILQFYRTPTGIQVPRKSIVMLTQHYANVGIVSYEEQILLYQITADYFLEAFFLIFKPHPDDLLYYEVLFPDSLTIREKFPSEFLPLVFANKPEVVGTVTSSAIFLLAPYFDKAFSFTYPYDYQKEFKFIHRYYMAKKVIELLHPISVGLIGINENMLAHFFEAEEQEELLALAPVAESELIIVDKLAGSEMSREDILAMMLDIPETKAMLFLNDFKDYVFYDIDHKELFNEIVPITMTKKQRENPEFCSDLNDETIYFYSKNEEWRQMVRDQKYTKALKHAGLELSKEQVNAYEERIKVLEGILKATESRLLYYIEEDRNSKEPQAQETGDI